MPEEILNGESDLNGYDKKRKIMMVRVAEKKQDTTDIFYLSLERSDYQAMQAAAENIGGHVPGGLTSKEILANPIFLDAEHEYDSKDTARRLRAAYDQALSEKYIGQEFYGGIKVEQSDITGSEKNALNFIQNDCQDIIERGVKALGSIKYLPEFEKKEQEKKLLFDLSAAIDLKARGKEFSTLSEAGEYAYDVEGTTDYGGSCATDVNGSASEAMGAIGMMRGRKEVKGTCPFCKETTTFDPCRPKCVKCNSTPGNDRSKNNNGTQDRSAPSKNETFLEMLAITMEENKLKEKLKKEQLKKENINKLGLTALKNTD
jgi:hypothetical protein